MHIACVGIDRQGRFYVADLSGQLEDPPVLDACYMPADLKNAPFTAPQTVCTVA